MNKQKIEKWLDIAKWAPSGGNAQPWKVMILDCDKGSLRISIDQDYRKKPSLLDIDGSASVVGLGIFVETLSQTVQLDDYILEVEEVRSGATFFDAEIFIRISENVGTSFSEKVVIRAESIKQRATNRNKYKLEPLPSDFKEWMIAQCGKEKIKLVPVEEKQDRLRLIEVLSQLEKVRWENPRFLEDLLSEIGSDNNLGIPFYQLGVGLPEILMLKTLKVFRFLRGVLRLGFTSEIAKQSIRKPLLGAPSYFYLVGSGYSLEAFFYLGATVQRIWLAAQERGLGFQPLEGHLLAYSALRMSEPSKSLDLYQESQIKSIHLVAEKYIQYWGIDLREPLFGFRLGYPLAEAKISARKSVSEICVNLQK